MIVLPVIHVRDHTLTMANAALAQRLGCEGVFLISMDGRDAIVPTLAAAVKQAWPAGQIGINLLSHDPIEALHIAIRHGLDASWTDSPGVTSAGPCESARVIAELLMDRPHRFFGSVAFKYQRADPDAGQAARAAYRLGMIPTTSGEATGVAAAPAKIIAMRHALDQLNPSAPLALASGITPDNVTIYQQAGVTHALVATGISADEHTFDPQLLDRLMSAVRAQGMTPRLGCAPADS
jgi:uncharacterized protein